MKKTILTTILALCINVPAYALTEGTDYEVMPIPLPASQEDKIEVTEFFGYWCIHCYHLEPIIAKHINTFAYDTVFVPEHVVWVNERDFSFARLAAAVQQSGLKKQANQAIFDAISRDHIDLGSPSVLKQWLEQQTQFDGKKLFAAFESFSSQTRANQMADLTAQYGISSTPTVIVGGKYKLLFPDGFEAGMKTIDELIQKVRKERNMPTIDTKTVKKSVAAKLVNIANH